MSPFPWIIALSLAVGSILLFLGYLTRSPKRTYRGWTENHWLKDLGDDACREKACASLVNALENGTQSEAFFAMLVFSKVHLPAEERDRVCSAIRNAIGRDDLLLEDLGLRALVAMEGERAFPDLLRGLESDYSGAVVQSIREIEKLGSAARAAMPALERLHRAGSSLCGSELDQEIDQQIKVAAGRAIEKIHASDTEI